MFCGKCGFKNDEGTVFCTNCGAKFNNDVREENKISMSVAHNQKNRKVGIAAVAVIGILILLLGIFLLGGRSYKTTIDKYVNAQFQGDAGAIFKLFPKKMIDYMLKEADMDEDELTDKTNEAIEEQLDYIDRYLGEDWEVSYEILNVEKISDDELEELKDEYKDMDIKISAAKTVEVQLTIKAGETENSNSLDISVIKVGRSWYLDAGSMGRLF